MADGPGERPPPPKKRYKRLVDKDGVEMFEIRIVQWFDQNGKTWASYEVMTPPGAQEPGLSVKLGSLELVKAMILEAAGPSQVVD